MHKPSRYRIVIPKPVVVQPCILIKLLPLKP